MSGPAAFEPASFHADPGRLVLRFPLLLSGTAVAVCVAVVVAAWIWPATRALRDTAPGCWRVGTFFALAHAYLRWGYVRSTVLRLDEAGVTLRQPFSHWRLGWAELGSVRTTTWYEPTHRGGVAAGVRLLATDGRRLFIPDVLDVPRAELAALIGRRVRAAASPLA